MRNRVDLIEQFAELVVGGNDPRTLAERTLDVVLSLTNGRAAAVFTIDQERLTLFASRRLDQAALDNAQSIWRAGRESLTAGRTFYAADVNSETELPKSSGGGPLSLALIPVIGGEQFLGTMYVDSSDAHFCSAQDLDRLKKFSPIIAKAVTEVAHREPARDRAEAWQSYLERTPVEDMEREKLLLLLNRNEWNIARVARLMGVTRRTIYLRLARYKVPRERVRKTRETMVRPAAASAASGQ